MGGGKDSGSDSADAQVEAERERIAEIKRQFGITQENISPYLDAGTGALSSVISGSTIGGLDSTLADIFKSSTFGSLLDERTRAVEGQLSAGGLTRSGTAIQEAAAIPTDLGLALESLLTGRSQQLANTGVNAAIGQGNIGANASAQIGDALSSIGQAESSGVLADSQAQAQQTQQLVQMATTAAMFFSDPSLKENVEKISEAGGLSVYQWDWKDFTKGTLIDGCQTIGFMADEVKEKHPEYVYEFGGVMVIDYPKLLDKLELEHAHIS